MTIALWCVLAAALMHLPFATAAKWSGRYDNAQPRTYLGELSGWRLRSHWVQLNTLEAFPPFAAAVIIAHVLVGPNATADTLALGFIAFRTAYGLCYLADRASLRSLMFTGGLACVVGLFVVAAGA